MNNRDSGSILSENLSFSKERQQLATESVALCSSCFAEFLCKNEKARPPEELYATFCASLPHAGGYEKALFCRSLCNSDSGHLPKKEELFGWNLTAEAGSHGRITYVRNRYNDYAFQVFSKIIPNAKFSYATGFAEACENVFNNRCEYCILPIENSADGRLFVFYTMLDRFDLKICSVCEAESDDASSGSCYALVGKTLPPKIPRSLSFTFEFCITGENGNFFRDLTDAASAFSADLIKVDTLPTEYDRRLFRYYFNFTMPQTYIYAFALYLSLEYPGYIPVGCYPLWNYSSINEKGM